MERLSHSDSECECTSILCVLMCLCVIAIASCCLFVCFKLRTSMCLERVSAHMSSWVYVTADSVLSVCVSQCERKNSNLNPPPLSPGPLSLLLRLLTTSGKDLDP